MRRRFVFVHIKSGSAESIPLEMCRRTRASGKIARDTGQDTLYRTPARVSAGRTRHLEPGTGSRQISGTHVEDRRLSQRGQRKWQWPALKARIAHCGSLHKSRIAGLNDFVRLESCGAAAWWSGPPFSRGGDAGGFASHII